MAKKKKTKFQKALRKWKKNFLPSMMKPDTIAMFNIIGVLLVFAGGFSYLMFPERDTVSHEENRNLAVFPEFSVEDYFSGEYTEGIAHYYDDTIPNRHFFKTIISRDLMPLKGRRYGADNDEGDGVELYSTGFDNNKKSDETKEAEIQPAVEMTEAAEETALPEEHSTMPADSVKVTTGVQQTTKETATTAVTALPDDTEPAADGEISNEILVANKRGILLYGGAWGSEVEYAQIVNEYKNQIGRGVSVYSMVLPTNSSFYLPENYKDMAESEKTDLDSVEENLKNVYNVDAYTPLLMHKDEPIYSRTDHHWQPLGAYYAAEEFAKVAGVPFAEISEYTKKVLHGYVGTLYGYTQSATLLNNPEDFIYYEPKTKLTVTQYSQYFTDPVEVNLLLDPQYFDSSSYYLIFGMDDNIRHIKTSCRNGRTLVIFKDSYGNALLPFLTSSFENIYLCDVRYFLINPINFINQVGATDVLFTMCTYSAFGMNKESLRANLYNY